MNRKGSTAGSGSDAGLTASGLVDFLLTAGALKRLPRAGWRLAGILDCESVADHTFRVALIALVLGELVEGVDRLKLLQMAVLHDLPECILTDLPSTAVQAIGREVKQRAERGVWLQMLPACQQAQKWSALWEEFEAGQSIEAKLARAADKLDMLLQAYEYERAGFADLESFWGEGALQDHGLEPVRLMFAELRRRRGELESGYSAAQ
jgi:putative hydrolase of HD superfamily